MCIFALSQKMTPTVHHAMFDVIRKEGVCMVDYVEELEKVQAVCKQYGYRAYLQFNQIHIITKWEAWYFVPVELGTIKLMHGNSIGQVQRGYHRQFYGRKLSYEQLLTYVYEHESAKYMDKRMDFSFTKTGGMKCVSC